MLRTSRFAAAALALLLVSSAAQAHDTRLPIAADDLIIRLAGPGSPQIDFNFTAQEPILLSLNPSVNPTAVLVYGTGANAGSTGRLDLNPSLWTAEVDPGLGITGYLYSDPGGAISSVTLRQGELQVTGSTPAWPWAPTGPIDELWFWFVIEDEWLCAEADITNSFQILNDTDRLWFQGTTAPFSCPSQVCGNGVLEVGELCDDGNVVEGDGCSNDCQSDTCNAVNFNSTYEGIQSIIFDGYGCNNALCHNPANPNLVSQLDLTPGVSYDQLVNAASTIPSADGITILDRVEPSEPVASFLYEKLSAGTNGTPTGGVPMPFLGLVLTPAHLEAVEKWIRAGAPENLVVAETAALLGTCLPPPDPLKIEPPPPLPLGEGVQFLSTAWELPSNSEDELCYATYYDLTATNLVPEEDQLDCGYGSTNNPSGKCFYYNQRILRQDAQSHHSIIQLYAGDTEIDNSGAFGDFTYKPNYPNEPGAPSGPCDPMQVDPATGWHADCSSATVSGVACTGFGPTDVSTNAPTFAGSQEPYVDNIYADGVYSILPMTGWIIWNSHAFNLTSGDSTMSQYLDMYFAARNKRLFFAQGIFDVDKIFIQQVPPFETREYCKTYTVGGQGGSVEDVKVFELGSHTHKHGTKFRIWGPPNAPCDPGGFNVFSCEDAGCNCGPGDPAQLLYYSTQYTDPVQLEFDPPMALGTSTQDRTFLYCSLYDNGSTPSSPPVKQQSTSPTPPPFDFGGILLEIGGPCPDVDEPYVFGQAGTLAGVACMDGPNQGQACGAEAEPTRFCETVLFANDGVCDACTVMGGFTTEDEMFIVTGSFYVPEPPFALGIISGLVLLGLLNTRRKQTRI